MRYAETETLRAFLTDPEVNSGAFGEAMNAAAAAVAGTKLKDNQFLQCKLVDSLSEGNMDDATLADVCDFIESNRPAREAARTRWLGEDFLNTALANRLSKHAFDNGNGRTWRAMWRKYRRVTNYELGQFVAKLPETFLIANVPDDRVWTPSQREWLINRVAEYKEAIRQKRILRAAKLRQIKRRRKLRAEAAERIHTEIVPMTTQQINEFKQRFGIS